MTRRLDGWKTVSAWLHLSIRQCKRLASERTPVEQRLPIFRLVAGPTTRVCAHAEDLDAWVERMKAQTSSLAPGPPRASVTQSRASLRQERTRR